MKRRENTLVAKEKAENPLEILHYALHLHTWYFPILFWKDIYLIFSDYKNIHADYREFKVQNKYKKELKIF